MKRQSAGLNERQDSTLLCTLNTEAKTPLTQGKAEAVAPGNGSCQLLSHRNQHQDQPRDPASRQEEVAQQDLTSRQNVLITLSRW